MVKILLAVDGSEASFGAVRHMIKQFENLEHSMEIHLINVQSPLHGGVTSFISKDQVKQYHGDEGERALAGARRLLDAAGVPYQAHLFVGDPAETVTRFANEIACDQIVIGTRGESVIASILLGSVATKIIHLAAIPVLLVK
jgi:nucleotide-binding universal stress UspA family protein